MIPEHLPVEDHGLGIIRALTNCLLLGSALMAILLGGRVFSVVVLIAGILMAAYAAGLHAIQKRVFNIFLYFLLHIVLLFVTLAALAFLVPAPDGTRPDFFLLLMAAALGIISIIAATHSRVRGVRLFYPSIYFVFYPVVIYLLSFMFGNPLLRVLAYFTEAGLLVLCLLYQNRRSLVRAFFEADGYANVPYEKIRLANARKMLGMIALSLGIFVLIAIFDNGGVLFHLIAARIQDFLRWLAALLSSMRGEDAASALAGSAEASGNPYSDLLKALPEAESNPAMEAFWNTVVLILCIISAVIFTFIIIGAIRSFLREFRLSRRENNDISVYAPPPERSERQRRRESGLRFFDRSPNAQARRLYLRFIKMQPGSEHVRAFETPLEIEETAGARTAHAAPQVQEIHEIYERARYATEEVSPEEVRRMKTAFRAAEKSQFRNND